MRSQALYIEKPGPLPDCLTFKEVLLNEPKDGEVTVKYLASPVNPADFMNALGQYGSGAQFPLFPGLEGVAEVIKLGPKVTSLKVGDRVLPRSDQGTWRTHANIEADTALPVDPQLPPQISSTILTNPPTAYFLLKNAGLRPGDFVIQNAATSAVGITVIQLATIWGFRTVNVFRARSSPEANSQVVKDIKRMYGGDLFFTDKELAERPELIQEAVRNAVGASSARVAAAFDCVAGRDSEGLARQLTPGGVLYIYGGISGQMVNISPLNFIFRQIQIKGFWITPWAQDLSPEAKINILEVLGEITQLYDCGRLKLPPTQEIQFSKNNWRFAFDDSELRSMRTLPHKNMFIFN